MGWLIALIIGLIVGFVLGLWFCRSRRQPETSTQEDGPLQENAGGPGSWQDVASENGVEDPTRLPTGSPISQSDD